MKAMKVMKTAMKTKPAKAMKVMKAMKKVSAKLARRHLFAGKISKTKSGLSKSDFVKNKSGRVVSKKTSARSKKSPWIAACKAARAALKLKGFVPCKNGTEFYAKAKELY